MNIEQLRNDTPSCRQLIHFNNAGASLMPKRVLNAITQYLILEANIGGYEAARVQRKTITGIYSSLARLLNAKPGNIAFTTNATESFNRALSAIPFREGDVIVTTESDYASNFIAFIALKKRYGVNFKVIPNTGAGDIDLEAFERQIQSTPPRLVAVTHIPTNTGLVQPVEKIGEICASKDILYLVDACQSAGQLPLDVQRIKCDFLSATFRKFMRGPRGAGFLFVSDKALKMNLAPLFVDMRGATWTTEEEYELRKDAKRFEDWETSYALLMGSLEAVNYLLEIGIENIYQRNQKLLQHLRNRLEHIPGIQLLDYAPQLSNIVTIKVEDTNPNKLITHLNNHQINASITTRENALLDFKKKEVEWALRLSPHYYNTKEEIDKVCGILEIWNIGE